MSENRYGTQHLALTVDEKIRQLTAVTEWGLENLLQNQYLMHGFTHRLLQSFREKKKKISICPVGNGMLSVSANGDVYPCWMFIDEKPFYMGNVKKDDFLDIRAAAVIKVLNQFDLNTSPECRKCWIQSLCFGCRGSDWHVTGAINNHSECEEKRAMVETFILKACQVFLILKRREKEKEEQGRKKR
jgi:uncharacterized protein